MQKILIYILIVYGITTIVVYGDIFSKLRDWIAKKSEFIHSIFSCPLCFSTWLGFIASTVLILTGNSTPTQLLADTPVLLTIFLDGMFTAGAVWLLNQLDK